MRNAGHITGSVEFFFLQFKEQKTEEKKRFLFFLFTIVPIVLSVFLFLFARKGKLANICQIELYITLDKSCQELIDEAKIDPNKLFFEGKQNFPKKL